MKNAKHGIHCIGLSLNYLFGMASSLEKELHKKFIDAQYEYFKHIEPIRLKEMQDNIQGKVRNPFHWKFILAATINKQKTTEGFEEEISKKIDIGKYKKILLMLHPDKNPQRIEEATKYFQLVQTMINDGNHNILDDLMNSMDIWAKIKEISENESVYAREKYCNEVRYTDWFTWNPATSTEYVTEEELSELTKADNMRLEKEKERV